MSNQSYSVVITDDEPIAREILASYVAKMPELQLTEVCSNALEALRILSSQSVSILLMDINMPEINGMQLIRSLKEPPLVIFTTAYSEYAVESYELSAVDYLLKPISFPRFSKAMAKALDILSSRKGEGQDHVFFKAEGKWIKVQLKDILLIEGLKDYVRVYTSEKKLVVHSTMKSMEEQLVNHSGQFLRVHKSYIVNVDSVSEIHFLSLKLADQIIPIGNTYRETVTAAMQRLKR
jgi:two-component system, LytTR family, response regulator LytT